MRTYYYHFYMILLLGLFGVACGGGSEGTTETEATEEAAEEMEVAEEAGEEMAMSDPWTLQDVPCYDDKGNLQLANLYQMYPSHVREISNQEPNHYFILQAGHDLANRFRKCKGIDDWNDFSPIEEYVGAKLRNTSATGKRTDLMPMMEEQFMNVNPEFIRRAANLLIPAPGATQMNGLLFQQIYDYRYRQENRALYLAHRMLERYTLMEHEMRMYVNHAATITEDENGDIVRSGYNEEYMDFVAYRYEYRMVGMDIADTEGSSASPHYVTFWMRRYLDGSAPALLEAQEKVLAAYDRGWYNQVRKEGPKVQPKLTLLTSQAYAQKLQSAEDNPYALMDDYYGSDGSQDLVFVDESSITLYLDNGNTHMIEDQTDGEYEEDGTYYSYSGYIPGHHAVLVEESGYEYGELNWISLKNGEEISLSYFSHDFAVSPGGNYAMEKYEGYEEYGLKIYQFRNGMPELVYSTPFLHDGVATWISDHELVLNLSDETQGLLTLPKLPSLGHFDAAENEVAADSTHME